MVHIPNSAIPFEAFPSLTAFRIRDRRWTVTAGPPFTSRALLSGTEAHHRVSPLVFHSTELLTTTLLRIPQGFPFGSRRARVVLPCCLLVTTAFALALIPSVVPFTTPRSGFSPGLPFKSPLLGLACCASPWFAAGFPRWRSRFPCR